MLSFVYSKRVLTAIREQMYYFFFIRHLFRVLFLQKTVKKCAFMLVLVCFRLQWNEC